MGAIHGTAPQGRCEGGDDSSSSSPPSVSLDNVDSAVCSSGGSDDSEGGIGEEMVVEVLDGVGSEFAGGLQRGLACQDLAEYEESWNEVVYLWKVQPGVSVLAKATDRHY